MARTAAKLHKAASSGNLAVAPTTPPRQVGLVHSSSLPRSDTTTETLECNTHHSAAEPVHGDMGGPDVPSAVDEEETDREGGADRDSVQASQVQEGFAGLFKPAAVVLAASPFLSHAMSGMLGDDDDDDGKAGMRRHTSATLPASPFLLQAMSGLLGDDDNSS